jgi:glycosyltransferase involved in cell wall biosynthesis
MEILQLMDNFNASLYGGAGKVLIETGAVFLGEGNTVSVISKSSDIPNETYFKGLKFYTYNDIDGNIFEKFIHYRAQSVILFKEYLKKNKPGLILIHCSTATLGIVKLIKKLRIPVIYYFHSPWHMEYEVIRKGGNSLTFNLLQYIRKRHEYKCLKQSSGIVTLSQSMRDEMLNHHPATAHIPYRIIPGGANEKIFYPVKGKCEKSAVRKELNLSENVFYIISSRRLIPRTGVDLLIKAFKVIIDHYQAGKLSVKPELIITGKGECETELKELAAELNLKEYILFTGYISEEELAAYYRVSDLYVIPTRFLEGFGLSTVEAMASGLPVIGTDVGGTAEILSLIAPHLLIRAPESDLIAEKVLFMMNQDIGKRAENSFEIYKKEFRWGIHKKRLMEFFNELNDCN